MTFQAYILWQHRISQSYLTTFVINYDGSHGKESACNAGELGSVPGLGRSPGVGNGHPLQYSCLENSMDRGAWPSTVHGFTKSRTQLKQFGTCALGKRRELEYIHYDRISCSQVDAQVTFPFSQHKMSLKSNFTGSYSSSFFLSKHGFFPSRWERTFISFRLCEVRNQGRWAHQKTKDVPSERSLEPRSHWHCAYLVSDSRGQRGLSPSELNNCIFIVLLRSLGFCLFSASSTWYLFLVFKEIFPTPPRWWLVYKELPVWQMWL